MTFWYLFFIGLFFGSFANVISLRLHEKKPGIVMGHSECPNCKYLLKWYDNIPLLSWILLRGKCRKCHKSISWQYPIVELFFGILFLSAGLLANNHQIVVLIWYLIIFFALGILVLSDIRYMDIPDAVSLPTIGFLIISSLVNTFFVHIEEIPEIIPALLGFVAIYGLFSLSIIIPGILMSIQKRQSGPVRNAIISIIAFPFWIVFSLFGLGSAFEKIFDNTTDEEIPAWIGGGDLRLGIIMGFILGWKMGIMAVLFACIIGTVFYIPLLILGKTSSKSLVPFGPFLILSLILSLFFGNTILDYYLNIVHLI